MIKFTVPGEPQPWQRAGRAGRRSFTPDEMAAAQRTIQQYADLELRGNRLAYPSAGRFWLGCEFFLGVDRRNRNRNCDLDNLVKLVADALTGVIWYDDMQVVAITARKQTGVLHPRSIIRILADGDPE